MARGSVPLDEPLFALGGPVPAKRKLLIEPRAAAFGAPSAEGSWLYYGRRLGGPLPEDAPVAGRDNKKNQRKERRIHFGVAV